jgi:inhibitor of KinA sporulation pathway (predicted exonuclease)
MHVVIFDLEGIKTFEKGEISHIIEIGAIRVNFDNDSLVLDDVFQQYVLPPNKYIRKSSRKMLGIQEEDMKSFPFLDEAMENFNTWLNEVDDYYLCSWSDSDIAILMYNYLVNPYQLKWFRNYNDIQKPISKVLSNDGKAVGLKKAIELAEVEKEGRFHSGLSDAINTMKIAFKYRDCTDLEVNDIGNSFKSSLFKKCNKCGDMYSHTSFKKGWNTCERCRNEQ